MGSPRETSERSGVVPVLWSPGRRRPPSVVFLLGLAGVALLAAVDYITGSELSFSIFYLGPIVQVTWLTDRRRGFALSLIAAGVWGTIDIAAGARYSSPLIPVWNSMVRFGFFAITVWLITKVQRAHASERDLARRDPLTGVANVRAFRELLNRELARARRTGSPLTVAYVDLDRFKSVNDRLGHAAGDDLLRAIGTRLRASVRTIDAVARLGGDEFVLLLPDTDKDAASVVLKRCRAEVRTAIESVEGMPEGVGASMGAVVFREPPETADEAIRAADHQMYEGKRAGRGRLLLAHWPAA